MRLPADTTVSGNLAFFRTTSNFSLNPHAMWVHNGVRDDAPEASVRHAWEGSGADFFPVSALRRRGRLRPKSGFINPKCVQYKHLSTGLQLPHTRVV
ncbi:hypothetical protein HBI42_096740 [Parastagonospora nodorum]|nr:hypothetical protein HBI43_005490 [Parastagonospora nodorum]KAH6259014.1 hypothetical protein HBI42_096740 [Parastagonospora nodorum]